MTILSGTSLGPYESGLSSAERHARLAQCWLYRLLRESNAVLIASAALVGAASGVLASALVSASQTLHIFLFGLAAGAHLSAVDALDGARMFLVLVVGGLLVGLTAALWRKRIGTIVDPIEANALHGGQMSTADSLFVAGQTLLSSGFGASLGVEGAFTQMAGAFGSKVGAIFRRRRYDVRMLVGAGAAGAIAGAFIAPFAGAAYAFELIIGSYTVATLAPVGAAAVAGMLASRTLFGEGYRFHVEAVSFTGSHEFLLLVAIGVACGLLAVVVMRGATATEQLARRINLSAEWRPMVGAVMLGCLGLATPHALGSGHGATELVFQSSLPLTFLVLVLGAKILASSVSIGSGFRGGLFATSLFLGALTGACLSNLAVDMGLVTADETSLFILVGMAAFGAAVIGTPLTMALLVIEISEKLAVAGPVLIGVVVSTLVVRAVFGYSFATWRFHLRGEAILGGGDVGWVRDMTAEKLMRGDLKTISAGTCVGAARAMHALGSVKSVAAIDTRGAFVGLLDIATLYACEDPFQKVDELLVHHHATVAGSMTIDRLLSEFEAREAEKLVVVDDARRIRGYVTEAFTLRRYRQELDRRQHEIFGNAYGHSGESLTMEPTLRHR